MTSRVLLVEDDVAIATAVVAAVERLRNIAIDQLVITDSKSKHERLDKAAKAVVSVSGVPAGADAYVDGVKLTDVEQLDADYLARARAHTPLFDKSPEFDEGPSFFERVLSSGRKPS